MRGAVNTSVPEWGLMRLSLNNTTHDSTIEPYCQYNEIVFTGRPHEIWFVIWWIAIILHEDSVRRKKLLTQSALRTAIEGTEREIDKFENFPSSCNFFFIHVVI